MDYVKCVTYRLHIMVMHVLVLQFNYWNTNISAHYWKETQKCICH